MYKNTKKYNINQGKKSIKERKKGVAIVFDTKKIIINRIPLLFQNI